MTDDDDTLCLNGINALTGEYLAPPRALAETAQMARGGAPAAGLAGWFRGLVKRMTGGGKSYGLPADVNPIKIEEAGWGVVFPAGTPDAVRDALRPLLALRTQQAGVLYKELDWRQGEGRESWLARFGAHGADVEPARVPYYLLLVGNPDVIPFEFQYELDVDYAVGRIAFDDAADYGLYATAVADYEAGGTVPAAREIVYWGTRHPADRATQLSADYLIGPLAAGEPAAGTVPAREPVVKKRGFGSRTLKGPDATRANLLDALRGPEHPALLFTASHGMGGWPKGDPRQLSAQGALLCQDWAGFGAVQPSHYLAAANLGPEFDFRGTVAFVFACYGAGTPRFDNFLQNPGAGPQEIAERAFVSALARRLLAGGALAVVGHIERAWGYSFQVPKVGAQLMPFRNFLGRVMDGEPVGHAMLDFGQRYASASVGLLNLLAPHQPGTKAATDSALVRLWVERNDAQNYVLLGDPAVRLRV